MHALSLRERMVKLLMESGSYMAWAKDFLPLHSLKGCFLVKGNGVVAEGFKPLSI